MKIYLSSSFNYDERIAFKFQTNGGMSPREALLTLRRVQFGSFAFVCLLYGVSLYLVKIGLFFNLSSHWEGVRAEDVYLWYESLEKNVVNCED